MQASLSLGWRKFQFFLAITGINVVCRLNVVTRGIRSVCSLAPVYTFFLCHCKEVLHFSYNLGPLVATCYKEISVFGYAFVQSIGGRAYLSQSQCLAVLDALFKVWCMCGSPV